MQAFIRCSLILMLAGLASACSSSSKSSSSMAVLTDECSRNRSQCIYEGSYEPGERDYAEEEAKRLNRAQAARLRGGFW